MLDFNTTFEKLTGNLPFPWQTALYERFKSNRPDNIPESCNLPTGLGKTSVIAVRLRAAANILREPQSCGQFTNQIQITVKFGHGLKAAENSGEKMFSIAWFNFNSALALRPMIAVLTQTFLQPWRILAAFPG